MQAVLVIQRGLVTVRAAHVKMLSYDVPGEVHLRARASLCSETASQKGLGITGEAGTMFHPVLVLSLPCAKCTPEP